MVGEGEAIGELVSGGLVSRAVEPATGMVADGHSHEGACLNCGTPLTGPYCHACGQRAHVHRTVGAFLHDLVHGVLHFEGKIWNTLPLLAWKPGDLTRRYIAGERAKFVSPIALFLFLVFLMFGAVSMTSNLNPNFTGTSQKNLAQAESESVAELKVLEKQRAAAIAAKQPTAKLDERIDEANSGIAMIRAMRKNGLTEAVLADRKATIHSSLPWIEQAYRKAKQNPQLLIYKLKNNAYKWSWALIPLSLPFLWLMFPFSRRFRAYDHIVFVTYSLCFMSLLVVAAVGLGYVGATSAAALLVLVPPVHMFRQLRGAYSLGWFGALWRTFVLMLAAVLVLSVYVVLMVALGALD